MTLAIMSNERLQYYMHDDMDAFRLELSGSLSGHGARSVYHAWRTALTTLGGRPLIADITFLTDVDEGGRRLLQWWRRQGVRITAASAQSSALAESILGEPASGPATTSGTGWLQRLTAAIRGHSAVTCRNSGTCRTSARGTSASVRNKSSEFTRVADSRELESQVP
jgi:hypothetical protein